MMPCPRTHDMEYRYRDGAGKLCCRECERLRRMGALPPKPDLMVRYCRNGHGPEHRSREPRGDIECRACRTSDAQRMRKAERRRANPEREHVSYRRRHLRRKYGITVEQYDAMVCSQRGVCAICGEPPERGALPVDHDHRTEMVRGLLCHRCNRLIGLAGDDPQLLAAAAMYLWSYAVGPPAAGCGAEVMVP